MAPKTKLVAFHPVHGYKIKPQQDLKTIKRNERERKRVETVNMGFETLRQHVPTASQIKKLSKVSILTEAMDYIQYLCNSLQHQPSSSDPVLLNFTQTGPPTSPRLYQPPVTPLTPQSPYQYGHHGHHQPSDQGFYSDYSQHSPAAWQPQHQYKHQPYFTPKQEPQYTPHHEPQYTPRHEPQYTPKQEPQYTPRHEPQYTIQHEAQCTPNNKAQPQFSLKQEVLSPQHLQYPQSAASQDDGESSGEEDDILDAIAEWQQL